MVHIRPYRNDDFNEICSWWRDHEEVPPLPGMMVEDGTFVLESDGKSLMTLTVFLTQSPEVAYFSGYCSKPGTARSISRAYGHILWEHCFTYLKSKGYKRAISFTAEEGLIRRYKELGMQEYAKGLVSLGRTV